jgi:hypothetical protein
MSRHFLFGVDPGIYQERNLKSDKPVTMSCVPVCWGSSPYPVVQDYFKKYFDLGASKGPQSSVSLLYYDYFMMYAKALEEVGSVDNPDAVVDSLLKMSYQGVVSPVPLTFNPHRKSPLRPKFAWSNQTPPTNLTAPRATAIRPQATPAGKEVASVSARPVGTARFEH